MGRLKVAPDVRPVVRAAFERWINEHEQRLKEFTAYGRLLHAFNAGWQAAQAAGLDRVDDTLPDGSPRTFTKEHDKDEQDRLLSYNVGRH